MLATISNAAICFIACHGASADHFAAFVQKLPESTAIEIYASESAISKFQSRNITVHPFKLHGLSSEEEDALAEQIAKACSASRIVFTDVGHLFNKKIHLALARQGTDVCRAAYYENPEKWVPGEYSTIAAQVMESAQRVYFANANLADQPIFKAPGEEVNFDGIKKIGIGYYPLAKAEEIAERRQAEKNSLQEKFLARHGLEAGKKILVYFGGNNSVYFNEAFPAFLSLLKNGAQNKDLSDFVFVLQQHPAAKSKNLDVDKLTEWQKNLDDLKNAPKIIVSDFNSDDAQVLADGALYYQTTMGPQFLLAGIPTVQIGHETFKDVLVSNFLSPSVTQLDQFLEVLNTLALPKLEPENILKALGIRENWVEIFKKRI